MGQYVASLARALIYCHGKHVIHRDIKPENLLIGAQVLIYRHPCHWLYPVFISHFYLVLNMLTLLSFVQGEIKIADFGWSVHTFNRRRTMCGTLDYLPPEMGMLKIMTMVGSIVWFYQRKKKIEDDASVILSNLSETAILYLMWTFCGCSGECWARCKCGHLEPWCSLLWVSLWGPSFWG